mmetsp:Transcript_23229/g.38405  ORF Transcript_23229/g.38405 Transcript_23229/m.38405 type:complete len:373 (-) Transcript_23229:128-1246(-)
MMMMHSASIALPFFLGANLPWHEYGSDVAVRWNSAWFAHTFASLQKSVNSVRFWLHADGHATPVILKGGYVTAPGGANFESNLLELVQLAAAHELVLQIVLWSFGMCQDALRVTLVTDEHKTRSFVNHALVPMLRMLSHTERTDHIIIEVFNEPEWCVDELSCTTSHCVSLSDMQRFVSLCAEAVHRYSRLPVTIGSAAPSWAHHWFDEHLIRAGEATRGVLDLVNVHFWPWMYARHIDICKHSWHYFENNFGGSGSNITQTSKPCVVGEMPDHTEQHTAQQLLSCLERNGFRGGMFWALNDAKFPLKTAEAAMVSFQRADDSNSTLFWTLCRWLGSLSSISKAASLPSKKPQPQLPPSLAPVRQPTLLVPP